MMSETVQCSTSGLWDPAQEWIQALDKLIQYPGRGRIGCSAAACQVRRTSDWKGDKNTQKKYDTQDNMFADEAYFIHQFPMVGLVTVQSLKSLEMQLMTVWTGLKSKDWRKRRRSLHLVREMVACGAGQLEQFVDVLLNWREGVKSCLLDVRTQLVRDCCITVAYLAQEIGYKVRDCESASVGFLFSRVFKLSFTSSHPSFNYFSTSQNSLSAVVLLPSDSSFITVFIQDLFPLSAKECPADTKVFEGSPRNFSPTFSTSGHCTSSMTK